MPQHDRRFEAMVAEARVVLSSVNWAALTPHHATVLRGLEEFLVSEVQLAAGRVLYIHYAIVRPVVHFLLHRMLRKCPRLTTTAAQPSTGPPAAAPTSTTAVRAGESADFGSGAEGT